MFMRSQIKGGYKGGSRNTISSLLISENVKGQWQHYGMPSNGEIADYFCTDFYGFW